MATRSVRKATTNLDRGSTGSLNLDRFTPFGPPLPLRVRNLATSDAFGSERIQGAAGGGIDSRDSTPDASASLIWDSLGLSAGQLRQDRPSSALGAIGRDLPDLASQVDGSSSDSDDPDYTGMRYVTPHVLSDELRKMERSIEASILRSAESVIARIPDMLNAAESRIEQSVVEKVRIEYNRVGVACVADRSRTKTSFKEVQSRLHEATEAVFAVNQRLSQVSDNLNSRLEATNAEIAGLRGNLETLRSAMTDTPAAATLAELNDSIHALSLRLGAFEAAHQGLGDVNADRAQHVPNPSAQSRAQVNSRPECEPPPVFGASGVRGNADLPMGQNPSRYGSQIPPSRHQHIPSPPSEANSGETSYLGDLQAQVDRLKRKAQISADLIRMITSKDLASVTSKAQVLEIVNYDLKKLEELKKTVLQLEQKWEH